MSGDASAFSALGVAPGSDATTIEQAYRRLIKQHHPDREGGDVGKAAEINEAYRQLRRSRALRDPLELNEAPLLRPSAGQGAAFLALAVLMLLGVLLLATGPGQELGSRLAPSAFQRLPLGQTAPAAPVFETMDQQLNASGIDAAIRDALRIARDKDATALASASQSCHGELRAKPSVARLDRCAAFDDAVAQIQDRDPLRDRGPFSDLTITRRQWAAASQLSDDYLAIESRLSRIALRVELTLAPRQADQPPVEEASAD